MSSHPKTKFKKDEVWGHLGKGNKHHSKDRDAEVETIEEGHTQFEDESEFMKFDVNSMYKKDDFFDSISCTALNCEAQWGRTEYSEKLKIDF